MYVFKPEPWYHSGGRASALKNDSDFENGPRALFLAS